MFNYCEKLTGLEYLNFIGDVYGIDSKERFERVTELSNKFGIYDNLKELSVYAQRMPKSYNKLDEEENRDQVINALNLKLKTSSGAHRISPKVTIKDN